MDVLVLDLRKNTRPNPNKEDQYLDKESQSPSNGKAQTTHQERRPNHKNTTETPRKKAQTQPQGGKFEVGYGCLRLPPKEGTLPSSGPNREGREENMFCALCFWENALSQPDC